jgi:protein-S-isoprenylcysteine O-methyltransferase Ste14
VPVAWVLLRIRIEERFLRRELEGYDAYTRRVRHRLIPRVW